MRVACFDFPWNDLQNSLFCKKSRLLSLKIIKFSVCQTLYLCCEFFFLSPNSDFLAITKKQVDNKRCVADENSSQNFLPNHCLNEIILNVEEVWVLLTSHVKLYFWKISAIFHSQLSYFSNMLHIRFPMKIVWKQKQMNKLMKTKI